LYLINLSLVPKTLYDRKYNTPVSWDNPGDRVVLGPELLKEMEEQMVKIKQVLKETWDRHKSYVDKCRTPKEFKVGEHVFFKVKPKNISLKLGRYTKLAARYFVPYKILDRLRPVAYMLAFPDSMKVHNVFHL
jgi:hypothetical protein